MGGAKRLTQRVPEMAALSILLLAGCVEGVAVSANPDLPDQLLCVYTQSQFGEFLDFKKPDVVGWGGIVPFSAVDDGNLRVQRVPPRGENAVATLVVRGEKPKTAEFGGDVYYTVFRTSSDELRLRREPWSYSPEENGSDPFPLCGPYER
jgi:hypothetical protein